MSATDADGQPLRVDARWLVISTGRTSQTLFPAGGRHVYDRQIALLRVFEDYEGDDCRVLIEPCARGWWYSVKLAGRRLVAALVTDADEVRDGGVLGALWRTALDDAPATGDRAGRAAHAPAAPRVVAADTACRSEIAGDGWIAVGDAACTFDPLSGQGLHHAVQSAMASIDILTAGTAARHDYVRRADAGFAEYLRLRSEYYRRETRWPDRPFWVRRRRQARCIIGPTGARCLWVRADCT